MASLNKTWTYMVQKSCLTESNLIKLSLAITSQL